MATAIVERLRDALKQGRERLDLDFHHNVPVATLVTQHAALIDTLLKDSWQTLNLPFENIALIAVGGYGRQELLPYSDIDLLILVAEKTPKAIFEQIELWITLLWDLGLELGHSVRTVSETLNAAKQDITVITNLLDARLLIGEELLLQQMQAGIGVECMWSDEEFFRAKLNEQTQRYQKYSDTMYDLEPNIKNSPGGLRDLQNIFWVAKRHFGGNTLYDLVTQGFLTASEYEALQNSQLMLWKIRWALHMTAHRREDRLLFDYQVALAKQFNYQDNPHIKGIEQFMRDYYRSVLALRALNDMLLQLFREAIIESKHSPVITNINQRFQIHNNYIETTSDDVFIKTPSALLEIFILMCQHPNIKGVRAATIRLIRAHVYLIDETYRQNPAHQALFMTLLQQTCDISPHLRRMGRYGIMARYLPEFGRVTGQMQYDLYHIYTVDQHTLTVIANVCQFRQPDYTAIPLCQRIMATIPKPELLLIAALFHDIGKGSGHDHSDYGAKLVHAFCQNHGLNDYDTELVVWLVQYHLLMSNTAQRKEITDPAVVNQFANQVGDQLHLDYLYLLTVADICGTNPKLWNTWRDALLKQLYQAARNAIPRLSETPINKREIINTIQEQTLALLSTQPINIQAVTDLWKQWGDDYFLYDSAENIADRTKAILAHGDTKNPLIIIKPHHTQGSTEIFIYMPDQNYLFATCACVFDQLGLNILDARILTTNSGYTLDSFVVLDLEDRPIIDAQRIQQIQQRLLKALAPSAVIPKPAKRRLSKQVKHFKTPTEVIFDNSVDPHFTLMQVICADHPGVLARIGTAMVQCSIRLLQAKIVTLGARAEDVFFVTDVNHQPLTEAARQESLRQAICEHLSDLSS